MRRLREIMAEPSDGQSRLDKIVRQIAGLMVAEVCSIYLKRQDGSLELFATEGLNPGAVHNTLLKRGEGLVGRCAELAVPINEPDAQNHPAFSYRPETGEEIYHSFLAVPVLRGGDVLGVLTVQNKTQKEYSDEDVEVLQTTAMVLAEHLVSGAVAGVNTGAEFSRAVGHVVRGQPMSEGIALGHAVLHEPRVVVTELEAKDPEAETGRLEAAVDELKASIDEMLEQGELSATGEHRDVLEAYRMFAHDRGWLRRMKEAIRRGMTAEAAVERVQNDTRARMLRQADAYWRERLKDLDALSDRLLRVLAGSQRGARRHRRPAARHGARRAHHGSGRSARLRPVAPARAGHRGLRRAEPRRHRRQGARHCRPSARRAASSSGSIRAIPSSSMPRAARCTSGRAAGSSPPMATRPASARGASASTARCATSPPSPRTASASSCTSMPACRWTSRYLAESGADGIGLFRTELQFMLSASLPRLERQTQMYRTVVEQARGKPVVFRTLDVGGDKALPYLRQPEEENPALGWRAIRLALDRPVLLRTQIRALLRATAGQELRLLLPMVTTVGEVDMARAARRSRARSCMRRRGAPDPTTRAARRHDRGALAAVRAGRLAAARGFHLRRQQRPAAVSVRGRPQQRARLDQVRCAVGRAAAGAGGHRRRGQTPRSPAQPVRRDGRPAARGHGADRPRLPLDFDGAGLRRARSNR